MIHTLEKKSVVALSELLAKSSPESHAILRQAQDDIIVPAHAVVTAVNLQGFGLPASPHLTFRLKKNASLTLWNVYVGDQTAELHTNIIFDEPDARCENHTIYFGRGKGSLRFSMNHLHTATGGTSRIFADGILDDEAFCRYDGMIRIAQTGVQTDASLHEKTLMLSEHAKADAIPGLEIGTNDVKASHSAGMTRIDEEQLFYAASRGIGEQEAVAMIAEGFLEHALADFPDSDMLKPFQSLIHDYLCQ